MYSTILLHLFRWLLPRIPRRVALAPSDVQYDPGIGLMLLMPLLWACRLPVAGAGAGGHTSACRQPGMYGPIVPKPLLTVGLDSTRLSR